MGTNDIQMSINQSIQAAEIIVTSSVSEEDKVRIVVSNASGGNVITVKGKLNNQDDFDLLQTITGNAKVVVTVTTYDIIEIECTSYGSSSDHVKVVAGSFKIAGGSTSIGAPAGGTVSGDPITFTSSNSSVSIVATPLTNTIDFVTSSAPATKYQRTFNNTSDWTLNGSNYELTILSATHGKANPVVQTFEIIAGVEDVVFPTIIKTAGNDIILQVTQVPDLRYNGRVIIL
jgi:hypothetical protein